MWPLKTLVRPFFLVLMASTSLSALCLAEPPPSKPTNSIATYIDPRKIALDPVLLKSEHIEDYDISAYSPDDITGGPTRTSPEAPLPLKELSALERLYSDRIRYPIYQFGYDSFPRPQETSAGAAAQDTYILEPGDELSVVIRGQQSLTTSTTITSDGQLIIADLAPVSAAGRSIKSVQDELKAILSSSYNTDIFLSVTKMRRLSVSVMGQVAKAGQITLTTGQTLLDALALAGGIQKTGTLRQIKLVRNNQSTLIDLYGVLVYGSGTSDLSLREGDKIVVGNIGPTLCVAGAAKRPAIYEILPANRSLFADKTDNSQQLSLDDLLDLSGGPVMPSNTRYLRFDVNNSNRDNVTDVPNSMLRVFGDGDILYIGQASHTSPMQRSGSIELKGNTPLAGLFALAEAPSLSYLLNDPSVLGATTYPLIGMIIRWDRDQLTNRYITFSPQLILAGTGDKELKEGDSVILFSRDEIASLRAPSEQTVNDDHTDQGSQRKLHAALSEDIKNVLIEHAVFIRGSIRNAGAYPVADGTNLESLLAIAGGASLEANINNVEITQPRADKNAQRSIINLTSTPSSLITLHPGDTVRVNQKFRRLEDRHVLLAGEVKNPGTYDLIAGDTLQSLINRAGGLTAEAYAKGAIFSRKSERLREEERYKTQARSLELSLATALDQKNNDKKPNPDEIALAQDLITQLKGSEALGRLTVEADPTILAANPELDILLESEDKIYIPKRPLTVRVAGEVLSPAALQFRSGKNPRDYINESGGFTYNADSDRAFVVYPNGSAQPLAVSSWNQSAIMIPPGSTIIVPRDPKPLTFMDGAKDLAQILANLATTAIFAEDLRNNN